MIRKITLLLILSLSVNKLSAQDVVVEYIEPESDFIELKNELIDGGKSLKTIENAFLKWDYKLLRPYLDKKIRKKTRDFFKTHKDSMQKYNWTKRTHNGPLFSIISGGNFGITNKSNELRLHSTNKNYKIFEVDYSYYVKDSILHIYALESRRYPYKNRLNSCLPIVLKTNELTQSLRESIRKKDVGEIRNILTSLESLESELSGFSFFKQSSYNSQLSRNYGNLSWFLIFEKEYKEAIKAAEKGLKIDKGQTWIYTNLALSNLLAGNKKIAIELYNDLKNDISNNKRNFKELFIADLEEVKEAKLLDIMLYNEIIEEINK